MDTINNYNSNNRIESFCSLTFSTPEFDHMSTTAETFDELVILAQAFNEPRYTQCHGPSCKLVVCLEFH